MSKKAKDITTEEKIKEAARKIFTSKGYAAARTRDIAEEAGMNLALLNYYFRSKEKLFEIVMIENFMHFISGIKTIMYNEETSLKEKIQILVSFYIDKLSAQPDLPLFILNSVKANPKVIKGIFNKQILQKSYFFKQLQQELSKNKNATSNPINILINILSMIIFPFIGQPMINEIGLSKKEDFNNLLQERKKLLPIWIMQMIKGK